MITPTQQPVAIVATGCFNVLATILRLAAAYQ